MKISSPGDSSQPASNDPSMTVSAPATIAFGISPEYCRPPSANDRHAGRPAGQGRLVDSGYLRHADAGDHPSRANRARTDTDLDPVSTSIDQGLRPGSGRDIAAHNIDRRVVLQAGDHLDHAPRVTMRGVHHHEVDAGLDQQKRAFVCILSYADCCTDDESSTPVFGRVREGLALGEVLDRDQAPQSPHPVDERELFDLVPGEQHKCLIFPDIRPGGHQRHGRHDLANRSRRIGLEAHIAVGHDAQEGSFRVHHGHAGDSVSRA